MSESVHIGLGSNLGDRALQLARAMEALGRVAAVTLRDCSSLYETAAVGGPAQPRFLNAVVEIRCGLSPQGLLTVLKTLERELGRGPGGHVRWGPRELDLDVLLWGQRVIAAANLQVPHPELHRRRFVLEPLCELAAAQVHPVLRVTLAELLRKSPPQDVVRIDSVSWPRPARDPLEQRG